MASNVPSSDQLYSPIHSHQTRLLCLDGSDGLPGSQVSCSLHTADLLHPNIEGLLVRSNASATESLPEYDALSYTWGSGEKDSNIRCNGLQVPVTENLFEALRALRPPKNDSLFLWVDALCINQNDSSEKNEQVWNMLAIYQKARIVIAWLGAAEINMGHVLPATSADPFTASSDVKFNFRSAVEGLSYLYTRPWFKRLWVQQEIFAARKLEFQCGHHRFEWSHLLSYPKPLLEDPHHEIPEEIQRDAISSLDNMRKQVCNCFEFFYYRKSEEARQQPDFVETLIETALLDATNPRDYIYGILGMTRCPAKPMPIQDWVMARHTEVFIPIDYDADLTMILCAVTWVVLMKGGLRALARFKVFDMDHHGAFWGSLPSWVIDWRLSARLFQDRLYVDDSISVERRLMKHDPHLQFCEDNKDRGAKNPCNKLILRGTPDSRFYIKGNSVWEKRLSHPDSVAWHLQTDVQTTDLIVRMHAFLMNAFLMHGVMMPQDDECGGLWLLRPVGNNEFKVIACLPWGPIDPQTRWKWGWNSDPFQKLRSSREPLDQCRLLVRPETKRYHAEHPDRRREFGGLNMEDLNSANARKYTIV